VEETFEAAGGVFVSSPAAVAARAARIRAVVLDWDGVFNQGGKGDGAPNGFYEADSMGLNLLRFGLWRRTGALPAVALVTGEQNETAWRFACRESLDAVYLGVTDKRRALHHLCEKASLQPEEVALVFDDVNDLGMAERCGLRFMVRTSGSPLTRRYVVEHGLCDYVAGTDGANHAVREISELLLGLLGEYDGVVRARMALDADFVTYMQARAGRLPGRYVAGEAAGGNEIVAAPVT